MSFYTEKQRPHLAGGTNSESKDLIDVVQLIDLTDKPIGLTRDEIDSSYILDHVPLNDIQFAQANASLQQLALSNRRKLVIIDLVDGNIGDDPSAASRNNNHQIIKETKVVNLAAFGLTMEDIIYWRWLDDYELAILSNDALYTCHINQQNISHPAFTALTNRSRYLSMERICDLHQRISAFCQVTDIHRDSAKNFYAISSLYSPKISDSTATIPLNTHQQSGSPLPNAINSIHQTLALSSALRPNFGSVPSKLSQLTNNNKSFDSLNSEHLFDFHRSQDIASNTDKQGDICGLAQIYCKLRVRSQVIRAHAIAFTSESNNRPSSSKGDTNYVDESDKKSTILVAANKVEEKIRIHFVEMFGSGSQKTGQNNLQTTKFDRMTHIDFPSSIVCSHLESPEMRPLHVAMITTKYGQLLVCSVTHGTLLFNIILTTDIISSTILESRTGGLMAICRNGQILLAKPNASAIVKLLDEKKTLRYSASSHSFLSSMDIVNNNTVSISDSDQTPDIDQDEQSSSFDIGLDIIISTKL